MKQEENLCVKRSKCVFNFEASNLRCTDLEDRKVERRASYFAGLGAEEE